LRSPPAACTHAPLAQGTARSSHQRVTNSLREKYTFTCVIRTGDGARRRPGRGAYPALQAMATCRARSGDTSTQRSWRRGHAIDGWATAAASRNGAGDALVRRARPRAAREVAGRARSPRPSARLRPRKRRPRRVVRNLTCERQRTRIWALTSWSTSGPATRTAASWTEPTLLTRDEPVQMGASAPTFAAYTLASEVVTGNS
jgi:hypothetical protein